MAFQAAIILISTVGLVSVVGKLFGRQSDDPIYKFMRGRLSLQLLNSVVSLVAASVVVTATELTITWNGLTGVSDLDTAGQLIPFLIGLSIMGRVLFLASSDNLGPDPKPIDPYRTLPVTARLPPRSRASHSHHREQRHRRHRRQ